MPSAAVRERLPDRQRNHKRASNPTWPQPGCGAPTTDRPAQWRSGNSAGLQRDFRAPRTSLPGMPQANLGYGRDKRRVQTFAQRNAFVRQRKGLINLPAQRQNQRQDQNRFAMRARRMGLAALHCFAFLPAHISRMCCASSSRPVRSFTRTLNVSSVGPSARSAGLRRAELRPRPGLPMLSLFSANSSSRRARADRSAMPSVRRSASSNRLSACAAAPYPGRPTPDRATRG